METYICPNDRQLALRARLGTGWSSRAQSAQSRSSNRLTTEEEERILQVLKRNELLAESEKTRIDQMLQRLERLKSDSNPHTRGECAFCKQEFGRLSNLPVICSECGRQICPSCSFMVAVFNSKVDTMGSQLTRTSVDLQPGESQTEGTRSKWVPLMPGYTSMNTTPVHRIMGQFMRSRTSSVQENDSLASDQVVHDNGDQKTPGQFWHFKRQRQSLLNYIRTQNERRRGNRKISYITICKICREAGEVWKRSGAWFYKTLPKSQMSSCPTSPTTVHEQRQITTPTELVEPVSSLDDNENSWVRLQPRRRFSKLDGCEASESTDSTSQPVLGNGTIADDNKHISTIPPAKNQAPPPSEVLSIEPNVIGSTSLRDPIPGLSSQTSPRMSPSRQLETKRRVIGSEHPPTFISSQQPCTEANSCSPPNHSVMTSMPFHPAFSITKAVNSSNATSLTSSFAFPNASKKVASITGEQSVPPVLPTVSTYSGRRGTRTSYDDAPFGVLYFTLYHDTINKQLHVAIHKAKNLIAMDANGLSDPYVVCQIMPSSHSSPRPRTSTRPQCLNPVWNEALTFEPFEEKNMQQKTLRFAVLDEDLYGSDWLGEYWLSLSRLTSDRLTDFAVPLGPKKPLQRGEADLACPTRGKIQLGLRYFNEKRQLCIDVIRCSDLASMDPNGLSDPFVKLYLRPDKAKKTKQKTQVKKATLFPEFHELFYYDMDPNEAGSRTLEVTVWDFDRGPSNDFIGGLTLGAGAKAERRELWLAVFRQPHRRIEAWFQLSSRNDPGDETSTPGICD